MEIFYVDPGYGKDMTMISGEELTYVENDTYNPYSGVAFTGSSCIAKFPVPTSKLTSFTAYTLNGTTYYQNTHICLKFSIYCKDMTDEDSFAVQFGTYGKLLLGNGALQVVNDINSAGVTKTLTKNFSDGFHNIAYELLYSHWLKPSTSTGTTRLNPTSIHMQAEDGNVAGWLRHSTDTSYYTLVSYIYVIFPEASAGTFYVSRGCW